MVGAAVVVGHWMWTYTRRVGLVVMTIVGTRGYRRRVTTWAEIGHFCLLSEYSREKKTFNFTVIAPLILLLLLLLI
jgi:hypothetical protein